MALIQTKSLLSVSIIIIIASLSIVFISSLFIPQPSTNHIPLEYIPLPDANLNDTYLDFISDNVNSGGVVKDGIPAINNPQFISREKADLILADSEIVFGINFEGQIIAFPRQIMVFHEIVNTRGNQTKISITYCPLTGSAVGFIADLNNHETTFGTSGKLSNSNLVMYDRLTESYWPQILGQAVSGVNRGVSLEKFQVYWTTYGNWKAQYPDTLVLSSDTGHLFPYGISDPYGSYDDPNSFYNTGAPLFPTLYYDDRLPDKTVVIGIEINNSNLAIEKSLIQQDRVITTQLEDQDIVVFYDENLDVAKVFFSNIGEKSYTLKWENNQIIDDETQSVWTVDGVSNQGNLEQLVYFDTMWFGWSSFYPDTELLSL